MTSAVLKRRAATLKNLNKRKKHIIQTDEEEINENQREASPVQDDAQQVLHEGQTAQQCPDLESAFEQIAKEGFNGKLQRKGLEYLKHFNFVGAKAGTSGGVAMIECTISSCGVKLSYNIRGGTTSNITKHLRKHGILMSKQASNVALKSDEREAKFVEEVYHMYEQSKLEITKRAIFHIVKSKLPLNHIRDRNYLFVLEREGIWYKAPSRFWLTTQALPAAYKKTKERLRKKLDQFPERISITTDGWKNRKNQGFNTLTARFVVQGKCGLMLSERLVDFNGYTGSQTGSKVLEQLYEQVDNVGIHRSNYCPVYLTSDRGSNLQSAVKLSEGQVIGIPCFSHVMHRAALATMAGLEGNSAISNIIKVSTAFNQSIARSTSFMKWQEGQGYKPVMQFITVSKTRWHGYLDSMIRYCQLEERLRKWVRYEKDPSINVEPLKDFILDSYQLREVSALIYVFINVRDFDSAAQAVSQPTGVQYLRMVSSVINRLDCIARGESNKAIMADDKELGSWAKNIHDNCNDMIKEFSSTLSEQIKRRYTQQQLKDINVISYFDPFWQHDVAKWIQPKRGFLTFQAEVRKETKTGVVRLYRGLEAFYQQQLANQQEQQQLLQQVPQVQPAQPIVAQKSSMEVVSSANSSGQAVSAGNKAILPPPLVPQPIYSSAESERQFYAKRVGATKLNRALFMDSIMEDTDDLLLSDNDADKQLLKEMNVYEAESQMYRRNPDYLDPLEFWKQKRDIFPSLFKVALKVLPVPATSVLSEQVFSGAGRIATSERIQLAAATVEKLVYLQRSMTKQDVMSLQPSDFQEERRLVLAQQRLKAKDKAYKDALEKLNKSQAEAVEYADQVFLNIPDANDDQMVFQTEVTYQEQEVVPESETIVDVDEGLQEVFEEEEVEDFDEHLQAFVDKYKFMTPLRWQLMSEADKKEYLFGGLD